MRCVHLAVSAGILLGGGVAAADVQPVPAGTPVPHRHGVPGGLPSDPSARVTALADAYVKAYFAQFPDVASAQGWADADPSRLPDNSLGAREDWRDEEDALLDDLGRIEAVKLSAAAHITHDFLRELLEASSGQRVCETELWQVSPTWTGWQSNMTYLASIQPVGTAAARQAALSRFGELPRYLDQEIGRLREGIHRGYSAPKVNVQRVIEQMDGLLAGTVVESPFYDPATRDADAAFQQSFAKLIEGQIRPALRRYRDYLQHDYLPAAREAVAVAANPQGRACYRAAIRYHTSIRLEPEEVQQLGMAQMERVTAAMREIGSKSFGTGDPAQLLAKVRRPPFTFASRQHIVDVAKAAIERARGGLTRWFGLLPKGSVVVVPYPEFRERSAPGGEYQPGSDDGARPGTYYVNTYQPEAQSRAGLEATAFHETYPGHHLQGAIAKERQQTHPIQRYFGNSGYLEGWALYSERLADEMGLYSGDIDRVGLLSNEALRSGRLVVDSGIHALGWSRQQAINYLLAHTAETPERVAAEVDRYIAVPGQATAYMIGNLEIRRLREMAQKELGDRFSIQAFHDRVLEDGAVTLSMLREKITRWVEQERKRPQGEPADGVTPGAAGGGDR